jgi:hypothetical protein
MINHVSKDVMKRFDVNKFVELGILQGDTLMIVQDWFVEWYGLEFNTGPYGKNMRHRHAEPIPERVAKPRMYEVDFNAAVIANTHQMKSQGNINIEVEQSESTAWLKKKIDGGEFKSEDSVFFYLDAHDDSSLPEAYGGGSAPELSPKKQPLRDEIWEIRKLNNKPIISIDDWTLPGGFPDIRDVYYLDMIRDLIRDRTDVVFNTRDWNLHGKFSVFIFLDRREEELVEALKGLPLIMQRI